MNWNELKDKHFKWACENGQHDKEYSDGHWRMLMITEISEAVQADRNNKHADVVAYKRGYIDEPVPFSPKLFERYIKDTFEDELADVVLRILDYISLYEYEILRKPEDNYKELEQRRSITDFAFSFVYEIVYFGDSYLDIFDKLHISSGISHALHNIEDYCRFLHIDLEWHVKEKMKYNETRPRLNGKLY